MFHTAIDSILIGCVFALHQQRLGAWLSRQGWAVPAALVFVFVVSPLLAAGLRPYRVTVGFGLDAIGCGLLILAIQQPRTAVARSLATLLSHPLPTAVGVISYSLYLWQQPFLTTWNSTFTGRFPASVLAALSCALVSFFWIERPALRAKTILTRSSL